MRINHAICNIQNLSFNLHEQKGAAPGIEPGTPRTQSGDYTTKPSGQCDEYVAKVAERLI